MIDWEEMLRTESSEELKVAKLWLFQENMRLEKERNEFVRTREKFNEERMQFRKEMDELNHRSVMERKRLREESLFFDKKMAILQDGFRQLEEERKTLERERVIIEHEREQIRADRAAGYLGEGTVAELLFRNTGNPMALRKRYRDLVKIFHPDNMAGDEEIVQLINKEFARRRHEE